jgi:hypothetical protein
VWTDLGAVRDEIKMRNLSIMFPARHFSLIKEIWDLPKVTIRMSGDGSCRNMFYYLTKSHPRYKIIQNKCWGAALLPLPNSFETYLQGKSKELLRRKRARAFKLGFHFSIINPFDHLEEIIFINTSMPMRQGRPITVSYQNIDRIKVAFKHATKVYGVFDAKGVLKAYANTPISGEVFIFSTLLGHGDDLQKGIMYLLISEVIREMTEHKLQGGIPLWAMYDTFFGASKGLRYFKERLGFKPYRVKWVWDS